MKPEEAEYYYDYLWFKIGMFYALYYFNGHWRESAMVTNKELIEKGIKL